LSSAACATPASVSVSDTITVLAHQTPAVAIDINPGSAICVNTTVTFNAIPAYGGAYPTYNWKKNGVYVGSGPAYSYVPANGDNVLVEITSDYPCLTTNTASGAVTMSVGAAIAPVVEITAHPGTGITVGELDTLVANITSVGSGPVTYQWSVNHSPVSGATSAAYVSTFSNNDAVTCEVTGTNGCNLSDSATIHISVFNVGIKPVVVGESNIRLIPNPNKGEFYVSGTLSTVTDEEVTLEVTDMLGQVIYKNKVVAHDGVINERIKLTNTLANGMYMLNLHSDNDNKVFHFVVEQ